MTEREFMKWLHRRRSKYRTDTGDDEHKTLQERADAETLYLELERIIAKYRTVVEAKE